MKISTKGRYALRIMLDLAEHSAGEYIPIKDISERQDISIKYMEQIISLLTKAGYVKSLRGNNGGYRLAKHPEEYRVGDILRITEGSLCPTSCLEDHPNKCPRRSVCKTLPFWEGLNRVINEYVDAKTLQDLLEGGNKAYDYHI